MSYFNLRPHVPTANTCQDCDKHLRVVHSGTPRCDHCLPDDVSQLKTCASHLARYCNTRCQKNNWEAHRAHCQNTTQIIQLSRMLGPAAEARHLSFVDWCKHSDKQFAPSALWALGAGTDTDRTGTHLFVIYINVEETISTVGKKCFKRWVRTAKCASEAEVTQECAPKYSSRWKVPPAMPFCARILLVDDGLPNVVDMFDQIVDEVDIVKIRSEVFPGMECDWLPLLEDSVAAGDQLPIHRYIRRPGSTPAVNELRYRHMDLTQTDRVLHVHVASFCMDDSLPFGRNIQVLGIDMSKAPNPWTLYPYYSDWLTRLKRIVEQ
ncbi:hypothetical protein B0H10DRAFT_2006676 [Mycena sp. CBHHK59/15]|nr:hypothetical protein B0H10DRAFT_2006676 [Mycena sp. CBHHK59/15]